MQPKVITCPYPGELQLDSCWSSSLVFPIGQPYCTIYFWFYLPRRSGYLYFYSCLLGVFTGLYNSHSVVAMIVSPFFSSILFLFFSFSFTLSKPPAMSPFKMICALRLSAVVIYISAFKFNWKSLKSRRGCLCKEVKKVVFLAVREILKNIKTRLLEGHLL